MWPPAGLKTAAKAASSLEGVCNATDPTYTLACEQAKPGSRATPATLSPQGKPWPAEVVWQGRGYGVYPFWAHDATPKSDITVGAGITTHWSSTKNAELFEHDSCQMNLVGYHGGLGKAVPCKHLFLGERAFFYTTDEKFCCISGDKSKRQGFGPLTAPQRNWTQTLAYGGTGHLKTPFYEGEVKNYTLAFDFPPFVFWYCIAAAVLEPSSHPSTAGMLRISAFGPVPVQTPTWTTGRSSRARGAR